MELDRFRLVNLLINVLSKNHTFSLIEEGNPFSIQLNGNTFHIYIKKLTSACFKNQDIWRAQLPTRKTFESLKESDHPFLLLGYDEDNDVYASWDPLWTKQRLNIVDNVSFYSRRSLQNSAAKSDNFESLELATDGRVVCFPRKRIIDFLNNLQVFFPESFDSVAVSSKKRLSSNSVYKIFCDLNNLDGFRNFYKGKLSERTIKNYETAIRRLFSNGYIEENNKVFLEYDNLKDYPRAIDEFFEIPDMAQINDVWHSTFLAALRKYVDFLLSPEFQKISLSLSEEQKATVNTQEENLTDDDNIDADGKLKKIADKELLSLLRPFLDTEYKQLTKVYSIIADFYGSKFDNTMSLSDWRNLINKIDWTILDSKSDTSNCVVNPEEIGKKSSEVTVVPSVGKGKTIRVIFPDGKVICNHNAALTLTEVVKTVGPAKVRSLNIICCSFNLVSKLNEFNPLYVRSAKPVTSTLYVNTNNDTISKYKYISFISDRLGLNLKIDMVDRSELPAPPKRVKAVKSVISKENLYVLMPDGTQYINNDPSDTFAKVIAFANPELVEMLNIELRGENIISQSSQRNRIGAYKYVGSGFYVNTLCDNRKKYEIINKISYAFNLGIKAKLLNPSNKSKSTVKSSAKASTNNKKKVLLVQEGLIGQFVLSTMKYLQEKRKLKSFIPYFDNLNTNLVSISSFGAFALRNIFISASQNEIVSINSKKNQWFETRFYIHTQSLYLSNQWSNDGGEGLQLSEFIKMLCIVFKNQYTFEINRNGYYELWKN